MIYSHGISVVIPTFNRMSKVRKAIQSVLDQNHEAEEVIVVDNNSTDNTKEMIKSDFPQVKLLTEKKQGVSATRNKGIKNAKYPWIAFLDSDDAWHKKKLKTQIDSIIQENSAYRLIHTDETWFRNGKHINQMKKHKKDGGDIFKKCLDLCCISPSSVLIKKEVFDDLGYFDESLPACEDYDMWLRITSNEPVYFINELLTIKNGGHKDQLSKKYWGLDRFRVQSLEKIIFQNILNDNQKDLAYGVLIKKLKILINGAKKRNNQTVIKFYKQKYDQWKTFPYNFLNQEKNEK